jgi:putative tricarboxylic transport membrane protein
LLISFGLIALGSFVVYGTQSIAETQGYAQIGPRLFPYLIGVGMTLCGAVLGWQALSGGWRKVPLDQEGHDAPDWLAFAVISAGIVLHMLVIGWAGFIIASTLLFVMVARVSAVGGRCDASLPSLSPSSSSSYSRWAWA